LTSVSSKTTSKRTRFVVAAVTVVSVVATGIFLPKMQPQQAQLSTESVPSKPTVEPSPSRPPASLPNGTNIIPPQDLQGRGKLKIANGTTYDAAVKLVDSVSGKTQHFVYVQAKQEVTLKNISPCTCILKFNLGSDWNKTTQKFLQNRSFSKFGNPLDFKEVKKETGVEWMDYTVTLHPVPHGSARTTPIGESDF
jgi:hypothetical protein